MERMKIMIINTHVHICNMLNFVMTEEMVIEMMDKYHIDYCVVSNMDSANIYLFIM